MLATVAKRNYSLIGRILYKTNPQLAEQLENTAKPGEESDLNRIFLFYIRFERMDLPGYRDVHRRRLFAAVMLHFYYPHFLSDDVNNVLSTMKVGGKGKPFVQNIAACFNIDGPVLSRNLREAVVMYQAYDDFQDKVMQTVQNLRA